MAPADPDLPPRQAAAAHARRLAQLYDDLVPLARLRDGFQFAGLRVSFGSFMKGIIDDGPPFDIASRPAARLR